MNKRIHHPVVIIGNLYLMISRLIFCIKGLDYEAMGVKNLNWVQQYEPE